MMRAAGIDRDGSNDDDRVSHTRHARLSGLIAHIAARAGIHMYFSGCDRLHSSDHAGAAVLYRRRAAAWPARPTAAPRGCRRAARAAPAAIGAPSAAAPRWRTADSTLAHICPAHARRALTPILTKISNRNWATHAHAKPQRPQRNLVLWRLACRKNPTEEWFDGVRHSGILTMYGRYILNRWRE